MDFVANLVPYGLGLLAAGLLPVKKPRAYQAVCAALALLWGWLALALHLSHPGWASLAIAEAVLLLLLGVIDRQQIDLPVRKGPWAVAGIVLILYALLIFPLLVRLDAPGFAPGLFDTPYPVVLFTCGVLFFTVTPWAALLFAVPLLWALLGDPDASPAGQVGLQVALLAGFLFSVLPSALRREGGEGRPVPGLAYRIAHRHRTIFGYGLWGLILATVLLFLLSPAGQLRQIMINLALLSALGIALWLAFPAWQSFWYRSVAWWMARAGGRLWRGALFTLKWSIVVLAAAALWAYLTAPPATDPKKPAQSPPPAKTAASQEDWWRIEPRKLPSHLFFMALFSWLAYQAFRGRKRLVIGTFSGYGDEKLEKGLAAGLGPRLQSELARIADVYKVIDEMTPSAGRSVIEVTPGVLEVGDILKDASAITFGPLKVPMNFFVGLIGGVVSGPRLTGALHKVEDRFILTAEISGGGFSSNWRVDYSDFSDEEARLLPGDAIQKLVEHLAFRVATDLVAVGSPRWRAVRCYTDGLRSYREAQRQQRSKKFRLRDAERCLIRALNDDQRFMQCHYNLGVVYRELGENGSAQSAFRRALGEDATNFEACYALAEVLIVADKKYLEGAWFCKAGIGIKPDDARAWDLEAYACRYSHEERLAKNGSESDETPLPSTDLAWSEIQELNEIATALAWRSLCRQALAGKPAAVQRERTTAFTCIRNLAVVLARRGRFAESRQVFRQAAWLVPHDPDLRLFEGRTLFWDGAREDAAQAVEGIFAGGMSPVYQGLLWSVLAQLRGRSSPSEERLQKMRIAHRRFLDIAARVNGESLSELVKLGLESPDRTSPEERS